MFSACHPLWHVEKSFRMSKHDRQARPTYHRQHDSIEAHLTVVFAALAVSRWIKNHTGCRIKRFVRTARRYRTIEIQSGQQTTTSADPLPADLHEALTTIRQAGGAHYIEPSWDLIAIRRACVIDNAVSTVELTLPERQWLARLVEFSLPAAAAIGLFSLAVTGAYGYTLGQGTQLSAFAMLAAVYFGSGLSAQNVSVRPGVFVVNGLIRNRIVRHPVIQRMVASPGSVVLVVKGHDDISLRWAPLGLKYWRSGGQYIAQEIEQKYGSTEPPEANLIEIEKQWVRWRIVYWISITVLSSAPFALGFLVASLLG